MDCWNRVEGGDKPIHVYPTLDEVEHEIEGKPCWCNPEIVIDTLYLNGTEIKEVKMIIHNSFDGREFFETLEYKQ